MNIYEEFIQFDKNFSKGSLDFYGENSPLSNKGKKDFLLNYSNYLKSRYGNFCNSEKAVSKKESIAFLKKYKKRFSNLHFKAYKESYESVYTNWFFYTKRAYVKNDCVCFDDDFSFPLPAAKFFYQKALSYASFSVKIQKGFYRHLQEGNFIAGCTGIKIMDAKINVNLLKHREGIGGVQI